MHNLELELARSVEDEANETVEEPIPSSAPPVLTTTTIAPSVLTFIRAPSTAPRVPVVTSGPDTAGQSTSHFVLRPSIRSVPTTITATSIAGHSNNSTFVTRQTISTPVIQFDSPPVATLNAIPMQFGQALILFLPTHGDMVFLLRVIPLCQYFCGLCHRNPRMICGKWRRSLRIRAVCF